MIQFAALAERARPRENRRDGVGRRLLALQILVVVARDCTVRGFVLKLAVRRNEHGGHHCQGAERRRHHVGHHVAIVVLARPDKPALAAHDARHGIINQRIEIGNARLLKLFLILRIENFLENVLEAVIVGLADGILRGEPQILLDRQRVLEAGMGKGRNRRIQIMNALHDARPLEIENRLANLLPIRTREHQLRLARAGDADFRIAVDVAIGMTGDGNRLLPSADCRANAADENRRAEDRAVEHGANGAVGRLPHLVQVVLRHALGVRGDGRALDRDAVLFRRVGAVNRHLIARFVAVRQTEVVILRL